MAAENFKVKKGLEVGTAITATSSGVNVTGIVTATQFVGDGSGLTGVTGSGSGVVVKDEGSAVGTAGTINFVGSGVAATLSLGTATITVNAGGLDNVVEDTTPQLGGNLDLNGKFVNGTGGANITGVVTATTLKGNGDFVDIDVDGRADLDDLVVAGVSTFGNNINASGTSRFEIASMENGVLDGEISHNGDATTKIKFPSNKNISFDTDGTTRLNINNSGAIITGISTFSSNIDANGNLDVDGRTDLDDLVVSGVGTFSTRIDTNGVSFGTNTTTFAAKFADNAVANFGTDNDLKISHDDTHARITNTKGDIVVSGIISATSDIKVGSAITMDPTSGIVTATKFVGDGSGLTGVTASGSGVVVKHDGSNVGTAGTINFSTNLDVSAISAGIVTITASGGSSQNLFSTIAVSGQSNVVADSTTDTLTFAAGSNVTLTTNAGTDTVTIAAANDNTQLSSEQVQDIVGAMFSSNTETDITATYQDADGTIDLVVDLSSLNAGNLDSGTIPNGRFPATLPATSGANLTALNASEITSGTLPIARIDNDAVTFAKMQNVGTGVFIGRDSSGTGDIETLTAAEARTLLNVADGATAGITTASTNVTATWSITASDANGYEFTGPGQDGSEDDPDIYLMRGHKYRFVNTTGSSHPFEFRNATNDADYTDGITGSQSGTQEFSVQHDAPTALKYRCTIHTGNMLGNIYIVGQYLQNGADNRVVTATNAYQMIGEQALIFDGSRLGIGLTPSGIALDISRNTQGGIRITDTAVTDASYEIRTQTGNSTKMFRIYDPAAGEDRFQISSAGQVKVTETTNTSSTTTGALAVSGGVGVAKDVYIGGDIHVVHDGLAVNIFESNDNHSRLRIRSSDASQAQLEFADQTDADAGEIRYNHGADKMTFHVYDNTERLGITSEGLIQTVTRSAGVRRMILSGSPSNSSFNIEAHDGATGTSAGTNQGEIGLYYNDGTTLTDEAVIKFYRGSGAGDGYFGFNTGSSEKLRITAGGQIFIGGNTGWNESSSLLSIATDAAAGANMLSDSSAIYNHNNPAFIHVQNRYNTGTGQEAGIIFHSRSSYNGSWAIYGKRTSSNFLSDLIFRNRTASAASAERLRITSTGEVNIGGRLSIGDETTTAHAGQLQVIHNGGGNQTADTLCHFETNANDWIFQLENDEGAGTAHFVYFKKDGNNPGSITASNTQTNFNTSGSDRELKKNFESWTEDTLSLFKNINPQKFHFKFEDDSAEKTKGFIAQDMLDKFPEAYPKDRDGYYKFNPSGMVAYLMKALQEEIVKREALEARISALEGS